MRKNLSKFVLNDRNSSAMLCRENVIQQRSFTGAQKACQNSNGNTFTTTAAVTAHLKSSLCCARAGANAVSDAFFRLRQVAARFASTTMELHYVCSSSSGRALASRSSFVCVRTTTNTISLSFVCVRDQLTFLFHCLV
jgi:hypothetical protein